MGYATNLDVFEQLTTQTMYEQVGYVRYCIDNPLFEKFVPQVRYQTGRSSGTTCGDFQDFCSVQSMRNLRLLCSLTCGCGHPRSGLLYDGPTEGCPRDMCRSTPQFQDVLANLECRDLNVTELNAMPAWKSLRPVR